MMPISQNGDFLAILFFLKKTLIEHFVILDEEGFRVTLPKKFEDIKYAPDDVYTEKNLIN
jgi:hypothetical protein